MSETPNRITFDDFAKLDLRVATIREAAPHPDADRLLVLTLDDGGEGRTIVAGIRAHYAPETLVGRQIIIVANLEPRKMRGIESQGMLLAASNAEHTEVILLSPEKPIAPGSSVG
ncbi:MAG: methionine--tRNA ligase subunit beta [Phycisphaerales bacterium]|nr:methionine--tRNA ligase subunit beta [Phycisphaerales bacterium]